MRIHIPAIVIPGFTIEVEQDGQIAAPAIPEDPVASAREAIIAAYLLPAPDGLGRLPDANELATDLETVRIQTAEGKDGLAIVLGKIRERAGG